jgi:hypothetical protein
MSTVEAVCGKLVEDADRWREAADAMGTASQTAARLDLDANQFGRIAEDRGVVTAYAALKQKLTNLVTGAATEFDKISVTLTQVARTYLLEDQAGAHAMRRIEQQSR